MMNVPPGISSWSRLCVCTFVLFGCQVLFACRYNVRDLGFIDVGDRPYLLYIYPSPDMESAQADRMAELVQAALAESNVNPVRCDSDGGPSPETKAVFRTYPDLQLPGAVFASPDGQTQRLEFDLARANWEAQLTTQVKSLVESPKRDVVARLAAETFAVVLLLEGTEASATQLAHAAIRGAIERIHTTMALMPKSIARPPELVVLDPPSQSDEAILLWSLGLNAESTPEPRAAILYGRARWMGPIAKGEEITEENLARLLGIVGIDCECGMDLSWTRGTRLPVRWGQALYRQVAESLGFDPENPLVKIEAERILSRYGELATPAMGYSEISLDSTGEADAPNLSPSASESVATSSNPPPTLRPSTPEPLTTDPSGAVFLKRLLLIGGTLGGAVLVAGTVVVLRAGRQ